LSDTTLSPGEVVPREKQAQPERMAWIVITLSLVAFCVMCVTTTLFLQYFLFQSVMPMETVLRVGRGTVGLSEGVSAEQAETGRRDLSNNMIVRTDRIDSLSQATLSFYDSHLSENTLMAMVILRWDTQVRFERAFRPRFAWSSAINEIMLDEFSGRAEIIVPENLERQFVLSIATNGGVEARISESGRYSIIATEVQTRLVNHRGEVILVAPDRRTTSSVPPGEEAIFVIEDQRIVRQPTFEQLLDNSRLATYKLESENNDSGRYGLPTGQWACRQPGTPRGEIHALLSPDGLDSLQLTRLNGATNNGEVRCEQILGDPITGLGVNVTAYDYLAIQALIYIDFQSLNVCGTAASECPLMLRLDYLTNAGVKEQWYHGVYARSDPGVEARLSCDSCPRDHIYVYEDAWYLYDSGNLLEFFQPDSRPVAITDVTFYASGHEFNVFIDEISLLARRSQPLTVIEESNNAPASDAR